MSTAPGPADWTVTSVVERSWWLARRHFPVFFTVCLMFNLPVLIGAAHVRLGRECVHGGVLDISVFPMISIDRRTQAGGLDGLRPSNIHFLLTRREGTMWGGEASPHPSCAYVL